MRCWEVDWDPDGSFVLVLGGEEEEVLVNMLDGDGMIQGEDEE